MACRGPIRVYEELRRSSLLLVMRSIEGKLGEVMGAHARGIHHHSQLNEAEKTEVSVGGNCRIQDDITLVSLLKACAKRKDLHKGNTLHADIRRRGLVQKNIFIGNTLIYMFAKCGALAKAQQVFD
eukprot:c34572_g1_i1 orf=133-510(+)